MQIKELLIGIPVLFFVFWVFTAPLPQERIARVCQPIQWMGNIATSTTALSSEKHTETSVRWSDKLNYSCQYLVWRLLYQDDYNKAMEAGLIKKDESGETKVVVDPSAADGATAPKEAAKQSAPTQDAAAKESVK